MVDRLDAVLAEDAVRAGISWSARIIPFAKRRAVCRAQLAAPLQQNNVALGWAIGVSCLCCRRNEVRRRVLKRWRWLCRSVCALLPPLDGRIEHEGGDDLQGPVYRGQRTMDDG
jgi:hypothetical protein